MRRKYHRGSLVGELKNHYQINIQSGKCQKKKKNNYQLNTKQSGEALELLSNLETNSVSLVFLDPQYEPVKNVFGFLVILVRKNKRRNFKKSW